MSSSSQQSSATNFGFWPASACQHLHITCVPVVARRSPRIMDERQGCQSITSYEPGHGYLVWYSNWYSNQNRKRNLRIIINWIGCGIRLPRPTKQLNIPIPIPDSMRPPRSPPRAGFLVSGYPSLPHFAGNLTPGRLASPGLPIGCRASIRGIRRSPCLARPCRYNPS